MANKKTTNSDNASAAESADKTEYAAVETRSLTPEQAAKEVVSNEAASSVDRRVEIPAPVDLNEGKVVIKDGYIIERVNEEGTKGLPIAVNSDEVYQAALKDGSVDYTATTKGDKGDLKK